MATNFAIDGNMTVGGATATYGDAATDKIGFYGSTPVVQPSGASQAAVTITCVTALATTVLSAAFTGMWAFSSSTAGQLWRTRINQLKVDVGAINVLLTKLRKDLVPTTGVGILKGGA